MNVSTYDFGDAPGKEVPDDDAPVVAAHGQQRAPAIEGAGQGHADAVQRAIGLLRGEGSGGGGQAAAAAVPPGRRAARSSRRDGGSPAGRGGRLPRGSSGRRTLQRKVKTAFRSEASPATPRPAPPERAPFTLLHRRGGGSIPGRRWAPGPARPPLSVPGPAHALRPRPGPRSPDPPSSSRFIAAAVPLPPSPSPKDPAEGKGGPKLELSRPGVRLNESPSRSLPPTAPRPTGTSQPVDDPNRDGRTQRRPRQPAAAGLGSAAGFRQSHGQPGACARKVPGGSRGRRAEGSGAGGRSSGSGGERSFTAVLGLLGFFDVFFFFIVQRPVGKG